MQESQSSFRTYLNYSLIVVIHFLYHVTLYALPILVVYMRDELRIDYSSAGLLWTIQAVFAMLLSFLVGYLSDHYVSTKHPLIFFSIITMVLSLILISTATSFVQLIIYFALMGIGASGFHPPAMALITEMFEGSKGKALSVNINLGMIGTAISPLIVLGLITVFKDWRKATLIMGIIIGVFSVIAILLSWLVLNHKQPLRTPLAVNSLLIDEQPSHVPAVQSSYERKTLAFWLSGFILFPLVLITIRSSFFKTASFFTTLLYTDYLSLTKEQAIYATTLVIGIGSMFNVVGGAFSDRTKPRNAIIVSSIGTFISSLVLVFVITSNNLLLFSAFYFMLIASYYLAAPAVSALLADRVPSAERGKLFGILFSLGQIFSMFTPAIFGYIKEAYGIVSAFGFMLLLGILALILSIYIFMDDKANYDRYSRHSTTTGTSVVT